MLYAATQYGGIFYSHEASSTIVGKGQNYSQAVITKCIDNNGNYTNASDCVNYGGIGYDIRYNYTALHVAPLYQNLADEAIVREALNDEGFNIKVTINPLPITKVEASYKQAENGFNAWFLVTLSFPFIMGSYATFVVAERQTKAKHLQTVAGVKPAAYWLSTWLWDVANYQFPLWITVILMFAFDITALTTTDNGIVGGVICLLVLFGPAAASFTYCVSFLFTSPSICNLVIIISGFLVGLGGSLASFILLLIGSDTGSPKHNLVVASNAIDWILRFIPPFCLSKGLFNAINIQAYESLEGRSINVWDNHILLWEVIFMACESVVYLILAIKLDEWSSNPFAVSLWQKFVRIVTLQFLCSSSKNVVEVTAITPDDDDVLAEQERVLSGRANNDLIVVSQLTKVYDNGKVAVNNLSFGIPPGQCFGLLGINGAGVFRLPREK